MPPARLPVMIKCTRLRCTRRPSSLRSIGPRNRLRIVHVPACAARAGVGAAQLMTDDCRARARFAERTAAAFATRVFARLQSKRPRTPPRRFAVIVSTTRSRWMFSPSSVRSIGLITSRRIEHVLPAVTWSTTRCVALCVGTPVTPLMVAVTVLTARRTPRCWTNRFTWTLTLTLPAGEAAVVRAEATDWDADAGTASASAATRDRNSTLMAGRAMWASSWGGWGGAGGACPPYPGGDRLTSHTCRLSPPGHAPVALPLARATFAKANDRTVGAGRRAAGRVRGSRYYTK